MNWIPRRLGWNIHICKEIYIAGKESGRTEANSAEELAYKDIVFNGDQRPVLLGSSRCLS